MSASNAAGASADAMVEAARIAADAAKFRPVGITTYGLGSSDFQRDAQGNVIGATYTSTPEFKNYQAQLARMATAQLGQAKGASEQYDPLRQTAGGLFDLSSRYLAQTPEESAQKYMMSQQNLLAPTRERQLAELRNRTFQTGREGLSIGATGLRPGGGLGLSASNPEMEAYYNSIAQQDAQLSANAEQEARNRILFGQNLATDAGGLLSGYYSGQVNALAPFQTSLGLQGSIENLAMTPLQVGAELGGRSATAGANAGQSLLFGGINAARTMQQANAYSPLANVLQGVGTNPYFAQIMQPYANAQQAMNQYGAQNVYGYGGQGQVPTVRTSFDDY
jgi:hypothetical protein